MIKLLGFMLLTFSVLGLNGCYQDTMSEKGFRLPDGDAVAGRNAFAYMQCHQCHEVEGDEFPLLPLQEPPYVVLGGLVTRVTTYGELVTSIINPSHKLARGYAEEMVSEDGESNMYNYNGYMTVQELADIVMYLQPKYEVMVPVTPFISHP